MILHVVAAAYGLTPAAVLGRHSGPAFKHREVAAMAEVTIGWVARIQSEIEARPVEDTLERIVAKP